MPISYHQYGVVNDIHLDAVNIQLELVCGYGQLMLLMQLIFQPTNIS